MKRDVWWRIGIIGLVVNIAGSLLLLTYAPIEIMDTGTLRTTIPDPNIWKFHWGTGLLSAGFILQLIAQFRR
jgi:hypothetical protein